MTYIGITHPRMGYKITTTPHDLRSAEVGTRFSYTHEHLAEDIPCRVLALSRSSLGQRKYLISITDDNLLWAVHPHYHTGVDLFIRDPGGQLWVADDMDGVSNALGRRVTDDDIADLVAKRQMLAEDDREVQRDPRYTRRYERAASR